MEELKVFYPKLDEVICSKNGLEEVGLYVDDCPAMQGDDGPPPHCVLRRCANPYDEEKCPGLEDMGRHAQEDGSKRIYILCNWEEDQTYLV
jgi:hypothetical protein